MRVLALSVVLLGLALAGCAKTKYDSSWQGGVEAERINETQFLITAQGNRWTDRHTIEEFALLKAAETTVANQKQRFKIVDANVKALRTVSSYGTSRPHTATVTMTIEMAGEDPSDLKQERYFEAQEVLDVLGPKHLPKPED